MLILAIATGAVLALALSTALFWPRVRATASVFPPTVSVLIPARNEEANLPACLDAVLAQGAVVQELLVYDDHSTDRTLAIIQAYAAQHSQLKLVPASALPVGWCGKNYACAQLARAAQGAWLLFLDADARLAPNAINRMRAEVEARQLTFLSCWPKFEMDSHAEKLLMPMLNFAVFSLYPSLLALVQRAELQRSASLGLAHGACLLFERMSYEDFGGHEQVKDQIFEDTRLAQLWRASGRAGLCLDGQDIVRLRMYSSGREIWHGFQKNFYPAFRHEASFWLFWLAHLSLFFAPFGLAIFLWHPWLLFAAGFIWLTRVVLAVRFRHPWWSCWLHPVAEAVLLGLGISSWWRYRTGQGVAWKGRVYPRGA